MTPAEKFHEVDQATGGRPISFGWNEAEPRNNTSKQNAFTKHLRRLECLLMSKTAIIHRRITGEILLGFTKNC